MKKLHFIFITGLGILITAGYVHATSIYTQNRILLVEIQPGSTQSATEEFIELYNDGFRTQNVKDWKVQYKSANGTSWLTKATLTGMIEPGGRYLIATFNTEENPRQDELSSGMAQGDGHIRILNDGGEMVDLLGWGSASEPLIESVVGPEKHQSLKRKVNEDGDFYADDNNFEDWDISNTPTPHGDFLEQETEISDTIQNPNVPGPVAQTPKPQTNSVSNTTTYTSAKIEITEFLPDPKSPQKDADDEFIELFNSTKQTVNLAGYKLQSGAKYRYSYTIPNVTIKPSQYLALFSVDTGLTLPNGGSQLRLLSPTGEVLSEFVYKESKPGQSWMKKPDGSWVMTTAPTPNYANTLATDTTSSSASKKTKENKEVSSDAVTLSGGSVLGDSTDTNASNDEQKDTETKVLNSAVLAGVGLLALLYAVYEYRYDIGNRIEQLRRYRENRRQNR